MYARSTSLTADPMRMDSGVATVRDELMPTMEAMPGCVGFSLLCDRDSGRVIATTSWDSAESMAATADHMQDIRRRGMEAFGGRDMTVDEWEIAVMHRLHGAGDDACCRVTWMRMDPARMESMLDGFRMTQLSLLDEMDGFCSVSLMVDRNTDRGSLTSMWRDRAAMDASRDRLMQARDDFTGRTGTEVTDVAEFAVVIHRLRVPEMA